MYSWHLHIMIIISTICSSCKCNLGSKSSMKYTHHSTLAHRRTSNEWVNKGAGTWRIFKDNDMWGQHHIKGKMETCPLLQQSEPLFLFQRWLSAWGWTQQYAGWVPECIYCLAERSASHRQGQRPVQTGSTLELGQVALHRTRAFQGHIENIIYVPSHSKCGR